MTLGPKDNKSWIICWEKLRKVEKNLEKLARKAGKNAEKMEKKPRKLGEKTGILGKALGGRFLKCWAIQPGPCFPINNVGIGFDLTRNFSSYHFEVVANNINNMDRRCSILQASSSITIISTYYNIIVYSVRHRGTHSTRYFTWYTRQCYILLLYLSYAIHIRIYI